MNRLRTSRQIGEFLCDAGGVLSGARLLVRQLTRGDRAFALGQRLSLGVSRDGAGGFADSRRNRRVVVKRAGHPHERRRGHRVHLRAGRSTVIVGYHVLLLRVFEPLRAQRQQAHRRRKIAPWC